MLLPNVLLMLSCVASIVLCASILATLKHAELCLHQSCCMSMHKFVLNHAWAELCPSKLLPCTTLVMGLAADI